MTEMCLIGSLTIDLSKQEMIMDNVKRYKKFADALNSKDIHQVYEVVSEMTFDELKEFVNKHEDDISIIDMDPNIYCYYQGIKDTIEIKYR